MAKKKAEPKLLRIKLVRSTIGNKQDQRDTVRTLGLRKMHQVVELPDTPVTRGMINKVIHLLKVEEVE
jgi:large subunit ribosomal protein L30